MVVFGNFRYLILLISLLHFGALMATTIAYNTTFVSIMNKETSPLFKGVNQSYNDIDWASPRLAIADRRYSYGSLEKSLTFAGVVLGNSGLYFASPVIAFSINALFMKYGAHKVMFVIGVFSTAITAATPFFIATSFYIFFGSRILAGISISNIFPVAGIVCNQWGTVDEKGLFIAVMSSYIELSCIFTTPISGFIAKNWNWPTVFYAHAAICAVTTLLWGLFYRDDPKNHPLASTTECAKIKVGKSTVMGNLEIPCCAILRTRSLWASWIATFGHIVAANFAVSFFAMFLTYGLHYDIVTSGIIPIGPMAVMLVVKLLSGFLSDKITFISELNRSRLFNSIGLYGSGIFFILGGSIGPFYNVMDTLLIAIAISIMGFCAGGYPKTVVLVARQHTPFAMTVLQMVLFSALIFGAFSVPFLTKDGTFNSWQNSFLLIGAIQIITNSFYILFARANPASWTRETPSDDSDLHNSVDTIVQHY